MYGKSRLSVNPVPGGRFLRRKNVRDGSDCEKVEKNDTITRLRSL